jgi:hypothetical protein
LDCRGGLHSIWHYGILQFVAFGQLTGERHATGLKYFVVLVFAVLFLIDWFFRATGWAMLEAFVVIVGMPLAIVHLTFLLIQEWRQG